MVKGGEITSSADKKASIALGASIIAAVVIIALLSTVH
jgi:hypothetical protein